MGAHGIRLPERAFWDRYLTLLQAAGIKPDQARWYVLRVEQYLKAHPDLVKKGDRTIFSLLPSTNDRFSRGGRTLGVQPAGR